MSYLTWSYDWIYLACLDFLLYLALVCFTPSFKPFIEFNVWEDSLNDDQTWSLIVFEVTGQAYVFSGWSWLVMEDKGALVAKQRMDASAALEARDGDLRKMIGETVDDRAVVVEKNMMPVNQVVEEAKLAARPDYKVVSAAAGTVPDGKVVVVPVDNNRALVLEKVYPAPLMSHDEVIRNSGVFMDALKRFHTIMGTKFKIPFVGGKDLDLHLLYVEVTRRGGIENVIHGRRWRKVITAMNFPPTTTSASFVLKKYYISLLHHFEQVYFFRFQGPLIPPAAILHTRRPSSKLTSHHPSQVHQLQQEKLLVARNKKSGLTDLESHKAFISIPCPPLTVSGTIDSEFEHGYLVSVKIGQETLKGVLFNMSPEPYEGAAAVSTPIVPPPAFSNGIIPYGSLPIGPAWSRKKARSRNLEHPKHSWSMYNFFTKKHSKLKKLVPQRVLTQGTQVQTQGRGEGGSPGHWVGGQGMSQAGNAGVQKD